MDVNLMYIVISFHLFSFLL